MGSVMNMALGAMLMTNIDDGMLSKLGYGSHRYHGGIFQAVGTATRMKRHAGPPCMAARHACACCVGMAHAELVKTAWSKQ
jgi:hypothetical protein